MSGSTLPTTPGSVVRGPAGTLYLCRFAGDWISSGGIAVDEPVAPFDVIFDAGEVTP